MQSESNESNRQDDISPAMDEAMGQANLPADKERFLRNLLTGPFHKHEDVMAEMQQWISEKKRRLGK